MIAPRLGVPLVALALLATSALAAQNAPTSKPAQPSAPPGRVDSGGALYKKVGCYQCHANEAQGGLSGPRLGPNVFPFARFSEYIRKPAGEMPPYTSKVLSDQDIADIYAWVQARPRPPAVNSIPQLAP
jgi:ubiquinol-cytochrome c reductase cytochrome c subunit